MSLFLTPSKGHAGALLRKQVGWRKFIYDLLEAQREAFIVDSQAGWTPGDASQRSCAAERGHKRADLVLFTPLALRSCISGQRRKTGHGLEQSWRR